MYTVQPDIRIAGPFRIWYNLIRKVKMFGSEFTISCTDFSTCNPNLIKAQISYDLGCCYFFNEERLGYMFLRPPKGSPPLFFLMAVPLKGGGVKGRAIKVKRTALKFFFPTVKFRLLLSKSGWKLRL